ncbi:MAG: hypothetical protein JSR59_06975 [Proteobacteria bacterium]|nr:hypothetical protein [Pseudomonadota bacterium]
MNRIVSTTIAAACAAFALTAGVTTSAEARPVATAWHGGGWHGGGWHGGGWHGGYRGGYWYHGSWWPGAAWGAAIGLGVGLGLGGYWAGSTWYPYPAYSYGYPVYADPPPAVVYDQPRVATPVPAAPATAPDPVIYPRKGQSAAQQEADHRACNRWATTQPNAMNDGNVFQRAVQACMDGRGYTLR